MTVEYAPAPNASLRARADFAVSLPVASTSTFWRIVQVTSSWTIVRPSAPSFGKEKLAITSTWSFGFTMPLTAAEPVQLTETARIFLRMSAARPPDIGLPPSMSAQKRSSPVLCPLRSLRPRTTSRLSIVRACPRRPLAGAVLSPRSDFEMTVPLGTSRAKHSTSIVWCFFRKSALSCWISASFDTR